MPIIHRSSVSVKSGTTYPAPFDAPCLTKHSLRLSDAGRLTQFGAHLVTLPPGCWSSQRHHHSAEDEFVYILTGHPTFIDDDGETQLSPGDTTCHPAGDGNAHHMINRTEADVTFIAVGSRRPEVDHCRYPDVNLDLPANGTPKRVFGGKD
ncbi:cupin domain-containing protein [Fretibacter rubidus]|uniref:cupin domain-containing protein n=1 Tax=Fretibacter rubidus TaxID=570162 RepID=UPI00352A7081